MNHFDTTILSRLLEPALSLRLTLTLLHFLWQGAVLGLVSLAADRVLRRATSRVRYAMFAGILAMMGAALPATFSLVRVGEEQQRIPLVTAPPSPAFVATTPSRPTTLRPAALTAPNATAPSRDPATTPMADPELADALSAAPTLTQPMPRSGLESYAAPIAVAYLAGIALMLARLAVALQGGRRLRLAATPISEGPITDLVRRQATQLGLKAAPLIAWCSRMSVPVVVGIVRPMILLPSALATGFDPSQLEALLTHELAHIRRFDPLVNLLQRLIEVLLFFHPAVWYVSRRVSAERENACDDLVLSAGWSAVGYAQALLQMAELCAAARGIAPQPNAVLAASGGGSSQFKGRVLRLLEIDDAPHLRLSRGGSILAVCAAMLACVTPTLIHAVTDKPSADAKLSEDAAAPDKSQLLERIFAVWKARQECVKSFHFTWDTRVVLPRGYEFPDESVLAGLQTRQTQVDSHEGLEFTVPRSEWWGLGQDRFRSDVPNVAYDETTGWKQTARIRLVRNGSLNSRLEIPLLAGKPPVMSVWRKVAIKDHFAAAGVSGDFLIKWREVDLAPLRLAIRPLVQPLENSSPTLYNTTAWLPTNCRLVSDKAIVGNVHCIKLEQHLDNHLETCWVDPARDFVIVLWERKEGDAPARSVRIEYRHDPGCGWIPSRWNWEVTTSAARPAATFEATVTSYTINQEFRDDPFALTRPAGTQVYDATVERPNFDDHKLSVADQARDSRRILNDIAAAWARRQANYKSFHFSWTRESLAPRSSAHSVWVDGERFASIWVAKMPAVAPSPDQGVRVRRKEPKQVFRPAAGIHRFRVAFDGNRSTTLSTRESPGGSWASAQVCPGLGEIVAQFPGETFLMDVFRPLDRQFGRFDLSKLHVAGRAKIGEVSCVVIETEVQGGHQQDYWVDPARDYLLLREHRTLNGQDCQRVDISYRLDPRSGWIPAGWQDAFAGEGGSTTSSVTDTVTEFSINQPIPDAEFKIEIPEGAQVNDMRNRKRK